jgi:hypothetical protein
LERARLHSKGALAQYLRVMVTLAKVFRFKKRIARVME